MAEPATSDSSPDTDRDFDASAEMLQQDYDDEKTLEEEEQNESGESFSNNELDDLAHDAEIPINDLLAMYLPNEGGMANEDEEDDEEEEEEEEEEEDLTNEEELTNGEAETIHNDIFSGHRTGTSDHSSTQRLLRSSANPDDESDTGSEDSDYVPPDDWKKDISVGADYQAVVPEGLSPYDDAPAYENEDRLLWDPFTLQAGDVERFLDQVHQPLPGAQGLKALPVGCHIRDDERALYILLQCGHNIEEALRRHRMQIAPPADEMSLWSEEECRNFESGLRTYGKNFHLIHQHKVRTRSVGELVQFYYLWKKTARHDMFANQSRLAKKKYHLHPGITDYMDRFLDDIDNSMSPPPAQSLLDKSRLHKPPNQVSMLALNGVPEMQNCSPEIGGLASGDLPHEASASDSKTPYSHVHYASRAMPGASDDGVPPAKKQKLGKESELSVLQNLNNYITNNVNVSLASPNTNHIAAPADASPPTKLLIAHNLQNSDPIMRSIPPQPAALPMSSGLKSTDGLSGSSREKLGSVLNQ